MNEGHRLKPTNKNIVNGVNSGVLKETDLKVPVGHMIVGVRISRNTDIMNDKCCPINGLVIMK